MYRSLWENLSGQKFKRNKFWKHKFIVKLCQWNGCSTFTRQIEHCFQIDVQRNSQIGNSLELWILSLNPVVRRIKNYFSCSRRWAVLCRGPWLSWYLLEFLCLRMLADGGMISVKMRKNVFPFHWIFFKCNNVYKKHNEKTFLKKPTHVYIHSKQKSSYRSKAEFSGFSLVLLKK